MAGKHIPEEIILEILPRLPVKSLIRFRCVSKRWRSLLSDSQFAKVQFKVSSEQKTLSRRRLLYRNTANTCQIESLDLEMPWYGDHCSITKLPGPYKFPEPVDVLGSCNGLLYGATPDAVICLHNYIWNPLTGFSLKLPNPGFSMEMKYIRYSGFGYLPATDDYKVLVAASTRYSSREEVAVEVRIFSTRAGLWKTIEPPSDESFHNKNRSAVLLGETLHWVCYYRWQIHLYAFDSVKEEFREMQMPTSGQDGDILCLQDVDSYGGCLYGFVYRYGKCNSIELWVMREYGLSGSWTKLFKLTNLNQLEIDKHQMPIYQIFLAAETSTVVKFANSKDLRMEIIRVEHNQDEPLVTDRLQRGGNISGMIVYEETLLLIPDYYAVPVKVKSRGLITKSLLCSSTYCFTLPKF